MVTYVWQISFENIIFIPYDCYSTLQLGRIKKEASNTKAYLYIELSNTNDAVPRSHISGNGVSIYRRFYCLFNSLFMLITEKTSVILIAAHLWEE